VSKDLIGRECGKGRRSVHFDEPGAIDLNAGALANDLGGEDEVLKDGAVDSGEGPGGGAGLLQGPGASGLLEDAALGNEDDVLSAELLLQLTDEPGLDLVEGLEKGDGDEDGNGPPASRELNLLGGGDVEETEISLELRDVALKLGEGGGNGEFELVGLPATGLDNLGSHPFRKRRWKVGGVRLCDRLRGSRVFTKNLRFSCSFKKKKKEKRKKGRAAKGELLK
jgi:hypothetical protein